MTAGWAEGGVVWFGMGGGVGVCGWEGVGAVVVAVLAVVVGVVDFMVVMMGVGVGQ